METARSKKWIQFRTRCAYEAENDRMPLTGIQSCDPIRVSNAATAVLAGGSTTAVLGSRPRITVFRASVEVAPQGSESLVGVNLPTG